MRWISRRTRRPPFPGADDEDAAGVLARAEAAQRALVHRAEDEAHPAEQDERDEEEADDDAGRSGHAHVADARRLRHRLDERDVGAQQQRGDEDALADLHEVALAHVAPLALVEAEEGEDDQAHRDERPDRRLEEVLVALGDPACEIAEAQPVGEEVGKGDQHPVDHELRERVAVQREGRGLQPPAHPRDCRRKRRTPPVSQRPAADTAATTSPTCSSRQRRPHRQREMGPRGLLGPGQDRVAPEVGERRLAVRGHGVVRPRADARRAQRGRQLLRARVAYDVEVPGRVGALGRDREARVVAEPRGGVRAPGGATALAPRVHVRELDAQGGGLQLVEAAVVADLREGLLVRRAVEAQRAHPLGQRGVVGRDRAAVAQAAEVLRRVEGERRDRAQRAGRRAAQP